MPRQNQRPTIDITEAQAERGKRTQGGHFVSDGSITWAKFSGMLRADIRKNLDEIAAIDAASPAKRRLHADRRTLLVNRVRVARASLLKFRWGFEEVQEGDVDEATGGADAGG